MKQILSLIILALGVANIPLFATDTVSNPVDVTSTDRVDFAEGGLIRIDGSFGLLNVEGWDKPMVEVAVTKSRPLRFGETASSADDRRRLDSVQIRTDRKSPGELTISTTLASRHGNWSPFLPAHTANDVNADYEIHVPRNSRLAIQHGAGLVQVRGVAGDIEASARRGDILLWLPLGSYSIDARANFGIVSSELDGAASNRFLLGERFTRSGPPPSHRLILRAGFGGITIRQIPPED